MPPHAHRRDAASPGPLPNLSPWEVTTRDPTGTDCAAAAGQRLAPALQCPPPVENDANKTLVHERHDTSILFSAEVLRTLTMPPVRPPQPPPPGDAPETVVPIALTPASLWQDALVWPALMVATTTALVVLFLVALHLLFS